ncbi:Sec-independent protein translocase protein TatB [Inmirania thermothiophila]|uniref:Sec-independent protein translocase protein TatB n=1 Tax=Inmirania thermothiophila TaxID=1750597 RepID=A0A3N1YA22_9GAMM|nr:Sec-independent protein translocase protein TatB [Inmirania thermothiophila]ROR34472.1 sec-independent protein translocase protein TatB [Inmirania thermothiophila]
MFDIGFWEVALVLLVALLVIGPERLPRVARTAGLWVARLRQMVGSVKADIEREIRAQELKELMEQQKAALGDLEPVEDLKEDLSRPIPVDAPPPAGKTARSAAEGGAGDKPSAS